MHRSDENEVREPRREGSFRADEDHVDVLGAGKLAECDDIRSAHRDAARDGGDARVTGGGDDLERRIVALELPGEGVLTPTAPDEEELHSRRALRSLKASRARVRTSVTVSIASFAWRR